ncbi:MAG TPA: hypothetical protein VNA57_05620 [Acidimicrobiales bacterium]|nr:hypothetical protein [Acidimicrobiales bacterium]
MEPIETPPSEAPRSSGRLSSTIVATGAAVALILAGLGVAGAQTGSSSTTPGPTAPAAGAQADKPAGVAGHHRHRKGHHLAAHKGLAAVAGTIGISEADLMTALRSGQSIADVARSKNVDVQKVVDALVAEARKHMAEKVAAGGLTQAQADQRLATLTERISAFVNKAGLRAGRHHGPGKGRHPGGKVGLATAASTIGISEADLMAALRSGQSIADVARSRNVDVQKVVATLVTEVRKRLAEKVAAGELTQAQADERSANLDERITALVNRAGRGPGLRGHRRPGGPEGADSYQSPDRERRRGFPGPGAGSDAPAPAPEVTNA